MTALDRRAFLAAAGASAVVPSPARARQASGWSPRSPMPWPAQEIYAAVHDGRIVTAGGLVFIGGTKDEKFHAFDSGTGRLLWDHKLPAGGYATPCTYSVNGKQYVTIAAGGGGKLRTPSGDAFITFALP